MLSRTLMLIGVAWILVTAIILGFLVIQSWQEVRRFGPVSRHIEYRAELDAVGDALTERFLPQVGAESGRPRLLADDAAVLHRLAVDGRALVDETATLVRQAAADLQKADHPGVAETAAEKMLVGAVSGIRQALSMEFSAHRTLMKELADYNERHLFVSVILVLLAPTAMAVFLVFLRRRVFTPLDDLGRLIGLLSRKDYSAAMNDEVDPTKSVGKSVISNSIPGLGRAAVPPHSLGPGIGLDPGHQLARAGIGRLEAAERECEFQAQLAHMGRISLMGELTTTLAHEFNNPLGSIANYTTSCLNRIKQGAPADTLAPLLNICTPCSR